MSSHCDVAAKRDNTITICINGGIWHRNRDMEQGYGDGIISTYCIGEIIPGILSICGVHILKGMLRMEGVQRRVTKMMRRLDNMPYSEKINENKVNMELQHGVQVASLGKDT